MSVLFVTDDVDDGISPYEYLYQQIDVYQAHRNYSFILSIDQSSSNKVDSAPYRRPRCRRKQTCRLKSLLVSMLSLLFLANHFHWSMIFLSLSSLKIVSTYAATPLGTRSNRIENDSQCFLLDQSSISRVCSRTCQALPNLMKSNDDDDDPLRAYSLSFCSMFPINRTFLFNETNETGCQDFLRQLITADDEARRASDRFTTYMQAIDSGSKENPYASINSNCQQAYGIWACSVKIPFYHLSQRILPCKTICDEVERACPTLRPSDREPLFAGQPLFFCSGGIVANSDYDQRPYCFDRCHLSNGSLKRHSVSSSSGTFSTSYESLAERMITTPQCFNIELHALAESNQSNSSAILDSHQHNRTFSSASSISLRSKSMLVVCFLLVILFGIRLDSCS